MDHATAPRHVEDFADPPLLILQALCPACGNPLLPLGGFWRCPRCLYRVCESCEGGAADQAAPP